MALFDSQDASRIKALFPGTDLDAVVWSESVDVFSDGATSVDVVLSSSKPAILADVRKVGLAYWPNGPVVRGVQNYAQGSTVTFAKVPVKPGGVLALVSSSPLGMGDLPARVDVVPAGRGESTEEQRRGQGGKSPLDQLAENVGLVLGIAALVAVAYLVSKAKP